MRRNWKNLVIILSITFVLMAMMVIYTTRVIYRTSYSYVKELGTDRTASITAELENYLETARSAIWVVSDTVLYMVEKGATNKEIEEYITRESRDTAAYFDSSYTGIYGLIRGEFIDGAGWTPPEGYDPKARSWYLELVKRDGEAAIVPPYVDAQTGKVIITVGRTIGTEGNILALDLTLEGVQEIVQGIEISGHGYGFVVNNDGFIIAHKDRNEIGSNYSQMDKNKELFQKISDVGKGNFDMTVDNRDCTIFVDKVMDQWYLVIVTAKNEIFRTQRSQMGFSILVSFIVFCLITVFYVFGYKKERKFNLKMEEMKVSEQKKDYEAKVLKLEKSAADAANKAKSDFLADMSHEIRTPINAVLGMNEMILRKSQDESILDYAGNIKIAGNTLLSIINTILDFSKIEDGKMTLVPVDFDVCEMISGLVNSISSRAAEKNLEFIPDIDETLPSRLYGDDVRISQVIMNLLTNAVKYTENGSVTLSMKVNGFDDDDRLSLRVLVKDTGIGIREEDIDKLAISFERLDEKKNRHIEGTGLGISIVTKLLLMMNSKLQVESEYGKGSVFFFDLSLEVSDSTPVGKYDEHKSLRNIKKEETDRLIIHKARILVTDDNDMNRKVASSFLELYGINAKVCSSGKETIDIMRNEKFDMVFLDHMMPKMDGIETLEILKKENLIDKNTTVIALTANAVVGAKEQYLKAGFDDYLSKPIELKELERLLKNYLPLDAWSTEGFSKTQKNTVDTDSHGNRLLALTKIGINTKEGISYCGCEESFYYEILKDYSKACEENCQRLDTLLEAGDYENYRILIHSVKSGSKTVGLEDLFKEAYGLEKASASADVDYLNKRHKEFITKYREIGAAILDIIEEQEA